MPDAPIARPLDSENVRAPRAVEHVYGGAAAQDGAGVSLVRMIPHALHRRLDPFLNLAAFGSDDPGEYIAGFPDHPHRGFETVTYMIAGRLCHRDHLGNEGLLQNGDVQWMTAGRGIIHSEMPEQEDGVMEGFQLWLNLPARDKMCAPWYRDIADAEIPQFATDEGARVRVVAGISHGVAGAVVRPDGTEPLYLDIELQPGGNFAQVLPAKHTALVHVYRGALGVGDADVPAKHMAILATTPNADGVTLRNEGAEPSRALLIAGRPLGEPIVQYGPFVMNSEREIHEAIEDYRAGRFA